MKNYEKPVVMVNEGLAEGVYAASGVVASCWTISGGSVQDSNGTHHIFEYFADHKKGVEHTSTGCVVKFTFNYNVKDAYSTNAGGIVDFKDNVVTVTISGFYDGYDEGDRKEIKLWVQASDEATTKALAVTNATIYDCGWQVNVQGGGSANETY